MRVIHPFDIETQHSDGTWKKTNWGGSDEKVVVERAKEIVATCRVNKDDPKKVMYGRTGVRVVRLVVAFVAMILVFVASYLDETFVYLAASIASYLVVALQFVAIYFDAKNNSYFSIAIWTFNGSMELAFFLISLR